MGMPQVAVRLAGAMYRRKVPNMARKQPQKPAAKAAPAAPQQPMQAVAATLAAAPVATPAPAATIALRGGQAVASVKLSGTQYRTAAPHNQLWWAALTKALVAGPAPVAGLLASPANPSGVPAHFVGYALRRGYLVAVPA